AILSASASSGLPVTYVSTTTAVCALQALTVTALKAGNCSITASQPGDGNYLAAPSVIQSFTVTKTQQSISLNPLSNVTLPASAIALTATATSGLEVIFTSTTSTTCTVSGSTVTPKAVGFCTIKASQAGNDVYAAAVDVSQTFVIAVATTGAVG